MSFGFGVGDFIAVIGLARRIRKNFVGAPSQFLEISAEVRSLDIVLQDIEVGVSDQELEENHRRNLVETLKNCEQVLLDVEKMITKYKLLDDEKLHVRHKAIRSWRKFTWDPAEISHLRDRIVSNITLLDTFLTFLSGQSILKIEKGVDRLNEKSDYRERIRILGWLTSMDHMSRHAKLISERQEGTGKWLIDSTAYRDWVNTATKTLFCAGSPGVGKSICASIVIDNLISTLRVQPEIGIAYIYCDYKRNSKVELETILLSLLKQLSQTRPSLPRSVSAMHERSLEIHKRPSLQDISEAICSVAKTYLRIFVIIDALDEFRAFENCQSRLMDEIFNIQSQVELKLFVTSRITRTTEMTAAFHENRLEIRASEADIGRYLGANMFRLPGFVNRNSTLQEEIIREIVRIADGIFLIARLHFESLEATKNIKHLRRALSNLCLGTAENSYASVYESTMERIQDQPKSRQELGMEALMWIACARQQLRVYQLCCALGVEEGNSDIDEEGLSEIEDIISACVGLIRIEGGYVRLVHQTTQTYFDQTKEKWFPNAEARIATLCITYLSYKIFECTNCNSEVGKCERDPDCEIELCMKTSENTFCYYAADNWGHHARAAIEIPSRVTEFLLDETKLTASAQMIWERRHDFMLDIGAYGHEVPSQVAGLHLAAYFGLTEFVSTFLEQNHVVDMRDTIGNSPFMWATIGNQPAAMMLLLERGANANIKNIYGDTPLINASRDGASTAVQLLIENGVDVDVGNKYDETALHAAAREGHETIVQQLLTHGASINSRAKLNGTALNMALSSHHLSVARLLIESGIDVDFPSENPGSPLRQAADLGFQDIVRLLLQNNANIHAIDERRGTALQAAAKWGRLEIIQILLDHDADVNAHPAKLGTALQIAASKGYLEIVRILLERDANVNLVAGEFSTALRAAASMGRKKRIELSHDKHGGISIHAYCENWHEGLDGKLPDISRRDHLEIIKCLVNKGADINAHGEGDGYATALQEASILGHLDVVQTLLDNNANPNIYGGKIGKKIGTALQAACAAGHHEIVLLLFRFNADAYIQAGRHGTAIHIASTKGRDDIVQALLGSS
ncbi:hypothetical protein N7490_007422 [Penicillium lividum]|nr:hypothetical protein N7490_007422 [Penicillium lividum]